MEEAKSKGRKLVIPGSVEDLPQEAAPIKAGKRDETMADKRMAGMNLEALHDRIELWGIAGVIAPLIARGLSGDKLGRAAEAAIKAARIVKAEWDKLGTEGKA